MKSNYRVTSLLMVAGRDFDTAGVCRGAGTASPPPHDMMMGGPGGYGRAGHG